MPAVDTYTQPRDKASGRFANSSQPESPVALVALSREGAPLGTKRPPKVRKLTHTVIRDAETIKAVTARSLASVKRDTELLAILNHAMQSEPMLHSAGKPGEGIIAARPPRELQSRIQPVYGSPETAQRVKTLYTAQLENEADEASIRIKTAQETLQAIEDGTYELREAEVLKWVTSLQAARQHITTLLGEDTANLSRLYIGRVVQSQPT